MPGTDPSVSTSSGYLRDLPETSQDQQKPHLQQHQQQEAQGKEEHQPSSFSISTGYLNVMNPNQQNQSMQQLQHQEQQQQQQQAPISASSGYITVKQPDKNNPQETRGHGLAQELWQEGYTRSRWLQKPSAIYLVFTLSAVPFIFCTIGQAKHIDQYKQKLNLLTMANTIFCIACCMCTFSLMAYSIKYLREFTPFTLSGKRRQIIHVIPALLLGVATTILTVCDDAEMRQTNNYITNISHSTTKADMVRLVDAGMMESEEWLKVTTAIFVCSQILFVVYFGLTNGENTLYLMQQKKTAVVFWSRFMYIVVCYCNGLMSVLCVFKAMRSGQRKFGVAPTVLTIESSLYCILFFGKLTTLNYKAPVPTIDLPGSDKTKITIFILAFFSFSLTISALTVLQSQVLLLVVTTGLHAISIYLCCVAFYEINSEKKPNKFNCNEIYLMIATLFSIMYAVFQGISIGINGEDNVIHRFTWVALFINLLHSVVQGTLILQIGHVRNPMVTGTTKTFQSAVLLLCFTNISTFVIRLAQLISSCCAKEIFRFYKERFWYVVFSCVESCGIFYHLLSFILIYDAWFGFIYKPQLDGLPS